MIHDSHIPSSRQLPIELAVLEDLIHTVLFQAIATHHRHSHNYGSLRHQEFPEALWNYNGVQEESVWDEMKWFRQSACVF